MNWRARMPRAFHLNGKALLSDCSYLLGRRIFMLSGGYERMAAMCG